MALHLQVIKRKIGKDIYWTRELVILQMPARGDKYHISANKKR